MSQTDKRKQSLYFPEDMLKEIQDEATPPMSPWALGFGLAYGTALGGLALFLWRWWRGTGSGPTQPGHWLLVFAGLGFCLDLVAMAAAETIVFLWTGFSDGHRVWNLHQCLGWSLGAIAALVVLCNLRKAANGWIIVTALLFVGMSLAALQHIVSFVAVELGAVDHAAPSIEASAPTRTGAPLIRVVQLAPS